MESIIEKVFAPALDAAKSTAATEKVEAGVVNPSVPSVSEANDVKMEQVKTASMSALADFVMRNMRINYDDRSKSGISDRLDYAIMAYTCRYNEKQKEYLRTIGVSERVYAPITATKVRSVYSMLMEIGQYGSDIPFTFEPTPDPDVPDEIAAETVARVQDEISAIFNGMAENGIQQIPPDVMQKVNSAVRGMTNGVYDMVESSKEDFAKRRAKRLQKKVWDTMVEGGYDEAYHKCLLDFCVYGTTVMVGPVMRNVAKNESFKDKKSGVRKIRRVIKPISCYESISPVDCYPSPGATEVSDGVLCVKVRYTREELWRYRSGSADGSSSQNGWRDRAIAKLLDDNEFGVTLNEFPGSRTVDEATGIDSASTESCKFEGVRCFAYVDGRKLLQIGIKKSIDGRTNIELDGFYYTETIVIGGIVVFCRIYDERVGFPLSKSNFYRVPGSWWGESIADKLYDVQSKANNASVSLIRNMGPASSAQLWIRDLSRLIDKSPDAMAAEPGKIWGFTSPQNGLAYGNADSGVPMGVLQIPSNAQELLRVMEWAVKQSDLDSGIPAFSEGVGGSNGGALRTAAGLAAYTENAIRGVKTVGTHLDRGVICGPAKLTANLILIDDDDMDLKGDVEVRPIGFMGKIMKIQMDSARNQFFNNSANNPFLQQLFGVKGMAALARPAIAEFVSNPDDVCPSRERLEFLEAVEVAKQVMQAAQERENPQAGQEQANPSEIAQEQEIPEGREPQGDVENRRAMA